MEFAQFTEYYKHWEEEDEEDGKGVMQRHAVEKHRVAKNFNFKRMSSSQDVTHITGISTHSGQE